MTDQLARSHLTHCEVATVTVYVSHKRALILSPLFIINGLLPSPLMGGQAFYGLP
jgi:hypothetical protein